MTVKGRLHQLVDELPEEMEETAIGAAEKALRPYRDMSQLQDDVQSTTAILDEMKAQIPRMNDIVAEAMKQEIVLKGQTEHLRKQIATLGGSMNAAVELGPQYEEEAKLLLPKMKQAMADLACKEAMLQTATAASETAKAARDDYMRQRQIEIEEAQNAASRAKQAQLQELISGMIVKPAPPFAGDKG